MKVSDGPFNMLRDFWKVSDCLKKVSDGLWKVSDYLFLKGQTVSKYFRPSLEDARWSQNGQGKVSYIILRRSWECVRWWGEDIRWSQRCEMVWGRYQIVQGRLQIVLGSCQIVLGRCEMVLRWCEMVLGSCQML